MKSEKLKGRPRSVNGRIKKIDVRLTEEELETLLTMEKELGVSRADLVRSKVLHSNPDILVNAKKVIRHLDSLGTELARNGNNINQLARYANILKKRDLLLPSVVERFHLLLEHFLTNQREIERALRSVIRLLGK